MIAVTDGAKLVRTVALLAALLARMPADGVAQATGVAPGQFHIGDRIALTIEPPVAFSDTVTVREGYTIRLPNIGDISMKGVDRRDTQRYLTQEIGKFVKNPIVRAVPLVRIAVLGAVGKPGYYSVPSDALISDVVMYAGGPNPIADMDKTVLRRNGEEILKPDAMKKALASGKTLDDLQVGPGDEVVVGEQSRRNLQTIVQLASLTLGVVGLIFTLARR